MGFFESLQRSKQQRSEGVGGSPIVSSFYTAPQAIAAEKPYYALVQAYKSWVYTCIDKIAKAVAMIPLNLYVYRKEKSGTKVTDLQWRTEYKFLRTQSEKRYFLKNMGLVKEQVYDHVFLDLINRPNPLMTRFMLWYETMVRLELGGMCGWYLAENGLKLPGEIWPLPLTQFANLRPKVSPTLRLEYWDYQDGDVKQRFKPEEILLFKYPHPASPFQAMSPLMAQTYPYDIDLFLMQQQRALFKNMGIPGITLETDAELDQDQVREIREQLELQFGSAMLAGLPMILHSGLKQSEKSMVTSGREAMLNEVQQFVREKLITAYDLSPSKVGLHEKDNRATAEVMDDTFVKECLRPKCMLMEEVIEDFHLPRYDKGLTCDFDLPSYPDRDYELKRREAYLSTGFHTINQEKEIDGEEPVEWGNRPWLPFGLMQPSGEKTGKIPPAAGGEEGAKGVKSLKLMNRAFWTEERKDVYWKLFVRRIDNYQHLIEKPMKRYFSDLKEEIINRFRKEGRSDVNISKKDEAKKLAEKTEPALRKIIEDVAQHRMKDILESMKLMKLQTQFEWNARVQEWLGSRLKKFSEQVSGTTFDEIERILKEGFTSESTIAEMAESLREKFDSWEEYRASNIARTETISAMNHGDIEGVRQTGLEDRLLKCWLSSRDAAVRPTHQQADDEYQDGIPIDDLFQVGDDEMDAPGEGTDPSEVCNCRCTLYYVEAEKGYPMRRTINTVDVKLLAERLASTFQKADEKSSKELSEFVGVQKDFVEMLRSGLSESSQKMVEAVELLAKSMEKMSDDQFDRIRDVLEVSQKNITVVSEPMDVNMNVNVSHEQQPIELTVKSEPVPVDLNLKLVDERKSKAQHLNIKRDKSGQMTGADIVEK